MTRTWWVVLVASGLLAVPGASASAPGNGSTVRVEVTPAAGSAHTRFQVSFVAPASSGRSAGADRTYELEVVGPPGRGCGSGASVPVPAVRAGERVHMALAPPAPSRSWCTGVHRGRLQETISPVCQRGRACADFVAVFTAGRFQFRVTQPVRNPGQPSFAGLQSAYACTPGPQRAGQTTPFTLTWRAATDTITPSAEIVYEIYMSTSPGGEDFSQPTWTTGPGVTSYKTPGLASHGTFYFVVRARDRQGNQDVNRVERRGVDPCV